MGGASHSTVRCSATPWPGALGVVVIGVADAPAVDVVVRFAASMEDEVVLKALLFDVQGTATDFHSTVCAEAQRISAGRYPDADWSKVVQRWRAGYFATLDAAPARSHGWVSVHSVYRRVLDAVLLESGLTDFSDGQREELTLAWERLMPWPDVVPGLTRMKRAFTIATLSNADVRAVVNLSKRAGLPWDAIFAAEMAGVFNPIRPSTAWRRPTSAWSRQRSRWSPATSTTSVRRASLVFKQLSSHGRWSSAPAARSICPMTAGSTSMPPTSSTSQISSAAEIRAPTALAACLVLVNERGTVPAGDHPVRGMGDR